jgi:hypothetical protein
MVIVLGTSIATLCMWFTTIILSLFFIPVVVASSQAVPWFLFGGISFVAILVSIFVLEETSPLIVAKKANLKKEKVASQVPKIDKESEMPDTKLSTTEVVKV